MSAPLAYATNWNVTEINGQQWLVIDAAQFRIPLDFDPNSNMFIAVAAPNGAVGNFPGLVKGDTGDTPTFSDTVNFVPLAYDDDTPSAVSLSEIGTDQYQLNVALHDGPPGETGVIYLLAAGDLVGVGDQLAGEILVVNQAANGFLFASQRVGDRYIPANIAAVPSGNAAYTLCSVVIPARPWDWRPEIEASCIITGTGPDVTVDLIARLSNTNGDGGETSGNEVGRGIGIAGDAGPFSPPFFSGPPQGSPDGYDRIPAGQQATIFFRAERQSGSDTFTTTAVTTRFKVRAAPCPSDIGSVTPTPIGTGNPESGPYTQAITTPGPFSVAVPNWATVVDVIPLGDGGGGAGGGSGPGSAGTGTSVTVGENTVTGAGGAGGVSGNATQANAAGQGPGAYVYLGQSYPGAGAVGPQATGISPGGGGGGGEALGLYGYGGKAGAFAGQTLSLAGIESISGTVGAGGAPFNGYGAGGGAPGAAWLVFRSA